MCVSPPCKFTPQARRFILLSHLPSTNFRSLLMICLQVATGRFWNTNKSKTFHQINHFHVRSTNPFDRKHFEASTALRLISFHSIIKIATPKMTHTLTEHQPFGKIQQPNPYYARTINVLIPRSSPAKKHPRCK